MNIIEFIGTNDSEKPLDRIVTDGGFCAIFRTIACIGDSLSSGEFESVNEDGSISYHDVFEYSWGQFIARSCGSKVYNFSRGGMTAKEYVESFADANDLWSKEKLAQAYIIALGVNDISMERAGKIEFGAVSDADFSDYHNNAKTFAGYYAQIISHIKELQPRAKIFLVTPLRHDDNLNEKRETINAILRGFTEIFDRTYLIDLYTFAPIHDDAFSAKFRLGHLTPAGYLVCARMIESYIDYIIRTRPNEFKQVGFIGTNFYYNNED
ncbi:MAG: SGNH/GDSL hydrolase family protein [Clostridia bacterium]|nr:SGNH/GDSL hydrolase family protein [Clostridia bacterium]